MQIKTRLGGKDVYWREPEGHVWEMLTVSYARPASPPLNRSGSARAPGRAAQRSAVSG